MKSTRGPTPGVADRSRLQPQVPFEGTVASVKRPTVSSEEVTSGSTRTLHGPTRFAERELRYREINGQLRPGLFNPWEEIINENDCYCLGESVVVKLSAWLWEPWLYRLANPLARPRRAARGVNLRYHECAGQRRGPLGSHQPDEAMATQDHIPDRGTATPVFLAYSDEMIAMVETALCDAGGKRPRGSSSFCARRLAWWSQ